VRRLSVAAARRLALTAAGLAGRRPDVVTGRHVRSVAQRLGVIQIDSVSAVARAHRLALFSRLGPHDDALLDRLAYSSPRRLTESWAHEAAFVPVQLVPLLRWRQELARERPRRIVAERPSYVSAVLAEVRDRGALTAAELSEPGERGGPWWGWSDGKRALEHLFATGELCVRERRAFARVYDLPERVLPPEVLAAPTLPEGQARSDLLLLAVRALGVATAADLGDYFRQQSTAARPLLTALVAAGGLEPVHVDGWAEKAYVVPGTAFPRRCAAAALVSPFDNSVFFRPRVARLWDAHLRIEIYVPEPRRVYGYYVLPFLLGERFVARVDVRAVRAEGVLRVPGAYLEPGASASAVAGPLAAELAELARWRGLDRIEVGDRGDLAPALARAVAALR